MRDDRIREIIFPARIIETEGNVKNAENLLKEKDIQIGLNEIDLCEINGKASILIDFGKEYHGSLRFLAYFAEHAKIRIRLGESISECFSELGEKGSTNDHSLRDIETKLENYSDMQFCQSGFRFAKIDFLEEKTVFLKSILLVYIHREIELKGNFHCNSEIVNKIYEVAAYTCHLNMQNYLWDGIKRDRLVWVGDIHPEMKSIVCMYGNDECIEKSLDFVVKQTPLPNWMNGISTYSMWWIMILHDYYMQNGNLEYVVKQKDYLVKLLNLINDKIGNEKIELENSFLDWPSQGKPEKENGIIALILMTAKKAANLLKVMKENDSVCNCILNKLSNYKAEITEAKQILAFNVLSERISAKEAYKNLTYGGAKGLSTFMSSYILKAIAQTNPTVALNIMTDYYKGMLELGATTFWEDFSIDWIENSCRIDEKIKEGQRDIHGDFGSYCYAGFRHSLCHGWSSGPVSFLTETVLGVNILSAGCKDIIIRPDLCGLTFAEGSYPTPYGTIKIKHRIENGLIFSKIIAPKEINITLENCILED